jgi:hypothetical protein
VHASNACTCESPGRHTTATRCAKTRRRVTESLRHILQQFATTCSLYHNRHWIRHDKILLIAIVSTFHFLHDGVGRSLQHPPQKNGLPSFDDFDETRHSGPARHASSAIFCFLGRQRTFRMNFPLNSSFMFFSSISCLYAQHAWRATLYGVSVEAT